MSNRVCYITGLPGSGKSTAAYELREWGVYPVVETGDEMKRLQESYSDQEYPGTWATAKKLREQFGSDGSIYPSIGEVAMALGANDSTIPGVIISGIRNLREIMAVEQLFDVENSYLVAVRTPKPKRQELFYNRSNYDEQYDDEVVARAVSDRELLRRTEREKEAGLAEVIKAADYHVWNTGSEQDLGVAMACLEDHFDGDASEEQIAERNIYTDYQRPQ